MGWASGWLLLVTWDVVSLGFVVVGVLVLRVLVGLISGFGFCRGFGCGMIGCSGWV